MRTMTLFTRARTTPARPSGSRRAGAGEPVLLVHPFMLSHHSWRPVMQRLSSRGYDVLAVSMPGHHGGPELGWRGATVGHLVDHLERELDRAGFETAHVVGNSLGGWATLELARRGRARTAIPIAPAGGYDGLALRDVAMGLTFVGAAATRPLLRAATLVPPATWPARRLRQVGLKALAHDPSRIPDLDAHHVMRSALAATHPLQVLAACVRSIPAVGLEEIACPVHLVFAERDLVIPPRLYAPYFTERLPHAEVTTLPGVGHCPQVEAPDTVADLIVDTIVRHSPASVAVAN